MCHCTPEIRTPFCGKPGCQWPAKTLDAAPDLLSDGEIEQMNAYLREHPPLVPPPIDLPFFDVKRIARTLTHLLGRVRSLEGQAWATMCDMLRKERDAALADAARLTVQRDGWTDECFLLVQQRDEAIAAARELLMCWVPPKHQNDYLKHWDWLKVAEPAAAPSAAPGVEER